MRNFRHALILLGLVITHNVVAQTNPTVELILSQAQAQQGDIVRADVFIQDAVNLGGADIGLHVDERCLQIDELQPADFLPSQSEAGGFSPFSELQPHDVRFAAAITDTSKSATGSGVFYALQLRVVCEQGTAPLEITFAELSAYQDPAAEPIELMAYTMNAGNVTLINTQLEIIVADDGTAQPTTSAESPTRTPDEPLETASPESVETAASAPDRSIAPLVVLPLLCIGSLLLLLGFWIFRRTAREDEESDE